MTSDLFIAVDLGGTRLRTARLTQNLKQWEIEARSETLTLAAEGPEAVIARMVAQIRAVWPSPSGQGSVQSVVKAIGISSPGPLDPRTGIVVAPPNLPGWHNVPLSSRLQAIFSVPVYINNDANLAALAELEQGAARGYRHVIYLTISTGIGGGIIIDGRMLIGADGLGAEVGQMLLILENGRVVRLEQEAAGLAIAQQAREALQSGVPSRMMRVIQDGLMQDVPAAQADFSVITAQVVGAAAKAGDELALSLITHAGTTIGIGIASLLHLFNPQIIVSGGGVAEGTGELLFKPLRAAVEQYAIDGAYWEKLVITPAALGENVALIGAGVLAARAGEV